MADGVLLVAKPAGVTSHDVVESVRRARSGKVGHAGTLDPFATGLLVVLVGKATRLAQYMVGLPKSYRAIARFGAVSDTGDPDGEITETGGVVTEQDVRAVLGGLTGEIQQRVPAFSAVKLGGERLYRKARRGETVEAPVRRVRVDRLDMVRFDTAAQEAELEIDCAAGTYVRQLVADLGELCGAGAYCAALERTAVGPFRLEDADRERLLPPASAVSFLPSRPLTAQEVDHVQHGRRIPLRTGLGEGVGHVRLMFEDRLIAVAESRDDHLQPVTVLA
jgi:tRNA pseudouridine55 synthase